MRQAMEDGVSEVLSGVVEDVGHAVSKNMNGAQLLQELLSAPWLHALLKMYECLLHFQRQSPRPFLPYALGLSHEVMTIILKSQCPSPEARELYSLLGSPHIQALLSSHDSVAQSDYEPVLPPLPEDLPEDEEAMRIVCLVKNNQPLSGEERRGSLGDGVEVISSRWSSLRRLTLKHLIPGRRAWSGEELRASESKARLLLHPKGGQTRPFLPRYESTGSCCLCPQTDGHWKKGRHQSAPSVFSPATWTDLSRDEGGSTGGSSEDYAYPPPPVPAYSLSLPNSPILYKKGVIGGQSRNIPTPGRTLSSPGLKPLRVHTAPCSPATQRSTRQQGVSTLPTPDRQHRYKKVPLNLPAVHSCTPHNGCNKQPKQTRNVQQQKQHRPPLASELTKQHSVDELRSTVQTVASSFEHSTEDVRHLGQKMVAATEMITDNMEENAQALNLLAEVVDKLQGIIVAKKHQESSPPCRPKHYPVPPPRVSSLPPKVIRKPPTPYPRQHSPSSSSCSSSSSTTSSSSCADGFVMSQSPKRMNGASSGRTAACGGAQRTGGSNGQVRFNRASMEDQKDCNRTGCLKTKKKKNK